MIDFKFEANDDIIHGYKSLWDIVGFLRDPEEGCPWDKEQQPIDIIRNLQGEVYEYLDALEEKDNEHIKEELGDIYLSLFLLTKIHDQNGDFKASDSINDACEKYIRRHPHVFSNIQAETSEQVLNNWDKIKRDIEGRKDNPDDFFAKIEKNAPELERCYKISKKATKVGFEWKDCNGVFDKVYEELQEVKDAKDEDNLTEELGDVLFSVVNLCRWKKVKPQDALHKANSKFIKRFNTLVKLADKPLEELSYDEWDELWNKSKEICRRPT